MTKRHKNGIVIAILGMVMMFLSSLLRADEITLKTIMPNMSSSTGKWTSVVPPMKICSYPAISGITVFPFAPAAPVSMDIPSIIPTTAKEVLLYVEMGKGGLVASNNLIYYYIYTKENDGTIYNKVLSLLDAAKDAWVTSHGNLWFPITDDRKIYIQCDSAVGGGGGNFYGYIWVIGYR